MSIVPQIALVKPNREVQQYVETSPNAIRQAIEDSGGSGQLTLQKGAYGTENPGQNITVPDGLDIIVMPSADISRVNFFDSSGDPSPNVYNFNNLGNIASVVNTITPGAGIAVSSQSGDVDLRVAENGITTDLIEDSAVGEEQLGAANTVNSGDVLSYNGTALEWTPAAVNADDPIAGDGTSSAPLVLNTKDSGTISLGVDNTQLVADVRDNSITETELANDAVTADVITGDPSDGDFLRYNSGLVWQGVDASDVSGGTFSGSFTFTSAITAGNGIDSEGAISVQNAGNIRAGGSGVGIEVDSTAGDLQLTAASDEIRLNAGSNILIDGGSSAIVNVLTQQFKLDVTDTLFSSSGSNVSLEGSGVFIHQDGYIDVPMREDGKPDPSPPPDGYIRIFAKSGNSDADDGEIVFVEPDGGAAGIGPTN
jgi:hypothetical protein